MNFLVINADDLGICQTTNDAIREAHCGGILTSASLLANGTAFEHAVREVVRPNPGLGIGVHLCLTSGSSVLDGMRIPLLVDQSGRFHHGFVSLYRQTRKAGQRRLLHTQIEEELDAQIRRVRSSGIEIDHLDGHRYIHMIPAIFDIVVQLAKRHQCQTVRLPWERFINLKHLFRRNRLLVAGRNLPKCLVLRRLSKTNVRRVDGIRFADYFHGVLDSGRMDERAIRSLLSSLPHGVTEIVTHPGRRPSAVNSNWSTGDRRFLCSPNRESEFDALVAPELRRQIDQLGIRLIRFADRPDRMTV